MTRGNQREVDRERARARAAMPGATKLSGSEQMKKIANDAEIMRQKQAAALAKKEVEEKAKTAVKK